MRIGNPALSNAEQGNNGMRAIIAGLVMCVGFPASAEVYFCKMTEYGRLKGIPNEVLLDVARDRSSVRVVDGMTLQKKLPPRKTVLTAANDTRLDFKWTVATTGTDSTGSSVSTKISYSGILFLQRSAVRITGIAHGYSSKYSADGKCRVVQK